MKNLIVVLALALGFMSCEKRGLVKDCKSFNPSLTIDTSSVTLVSEVLIHDTENLVAIIRVNEVQYILDNWYLTTGSFFTYQLDFKESIDRIEIVYKNCSLVIWHK